MGEMLARVLIVVLLCMAVMKGYAIDGDIERGGYEIDGGYLYCLSYGEEIV